MAEQDGVAVARLSVPNLGQALKFTASSMMSAVIDLGLFWVLRQVLQLPEPYLIYVATVVARCTSGLINFGLNRIWSFGATDREEYGRTRDQAGRYATLFVGKMVASAIIVQALAHLPLPLEVTKALVDIALFFANYLVQRDWVYSRK